MASVSSGSAPSSPASVTTKDTVKIEDGGRVKGVIMCIPIVYGNVAHPLEEKRADGRTHAWTVFVKPYYKEDLSPIIKKVHFKLHDSYSNSNRVITIPPYEVAETGWGEFEIVMKIFFHDPNERPVTLYHMLKLFHPQEVKDPHILAKPVIVENYDEVVFHDPPSYMRDLLTEHLSAEYEVDIYKTDFEKVKKENLEKLKRGKAIIDKELEETKMKLRVAQETLTRFKEEVAKCRKVTSAVSYFG